MKAIKKVEDIYSDPNYIGYYYIEDRHKMELEDWKETGIEIREKRGEKRGFEKAKIEFAKNMKEQNLDINLISKTTGLSPKKIISL